MLFSSHFFILVFLPPVLVLYYALGEHRRARLAVLLVSSLIFYAWWDVRFIPLLPASITVNWLLSRFFLARTGSWIIAAGVIFNLALLACFKYTNFFAESVLTLVGMEYRPLSIILPLGISFFTFQQISFLVDLKRGKAPGYSLLEFASFVCFFPQLIAGPIVRHDELIPQFKTRPLAKRGWELPARGLALFILGLVKKVFFADELAPIADSGFALAGSSGILPVETAWQSALAYSLQLYFDFSSYSDMALGLGAMFGFSLPLNFNNPYRATSIREFWRRWHMTLSRFLRDYVYIPLGGSRYGEYRACTVALITMLLCGLWHGAGWTFVFWGGLHGVAVCCNRAWRQADWPMPPILGWTITMFFVVIGWVIFRSSDFSQAFVFITAMFGNHGVIDVSVRDNWGLISVALAFSLFGPTNVELSRVDWLARHWIALALAVLLTGTLLRVGQGRGLEFIYFQF